MFESPILLRISPFAPFCGQHYGGVHRVYPEAAYGTMPFKAAQAKDGEA